MTMSQFANMMSSSSSSQSCCVSLWKFKITGRSFMSISFLVLELWQFLFIRDWPGIWKLGMPPSEFCPISGHWKELGIQNLANVSNEKLLTAAKNQGYSFYHFWVIKNKIGGKITPTQISPFKTPICLKKMLKKIDINKFNQKIANK